MSFEDTLLRLRLVARKNGKYVMNKLFDDYLTGHLNKEINASCLLCGSKSNLTKEHVLPKWVFENDPKRTFTTDVNQLPQKYREYSTHLPGKLYKKYPVPCTSKNMPPPTITFFYLNNK